MKILICGTHFTPAIATIEELKKNKDVQIIYVGRKSTLEGDQAKSAESYVLPRMGVEFIPLVAGRLYRSFSVAAFLSLLKIPIGFIHAFIILFKHKPDVILSFGGYLSVPVIFIGWLFSIPIIIHEQSLNFGIANKVSSVFADKIALSFDPKKRLTNSMVVTGNPLRKTIFEPLALRDANLIKLFKSADSEKKPVIFITGGNQGSHIINLTVEKILPDLVKKYFLIHITGDSMYKDFERLSQQQGKNYLVRKWIGDEFGKILESVDLVVSRGGMNTLMEIAYFGKPVLIIPLAEKLHKEQIMNAKFFSNLGLGDILPQSHLTGQSLLEFIEQILKYLPEKSKKAKGVKKIIIKDAAKRLSLETILLALK